MSLASRERKPIADDIQALARALYARNDIVLLDDVLSALDSETERMVVDRLLGPRGIFRKLGVTVILITHAS